jgi:hypothetical protein
MTNLPRLFTDKGELISVATSEMDGPTRERYAAIDTAYRANKAAQDVLDAAYAEVNDALEGVKNTTAYFDAHWPRQTYHDLWKETFGPQTRGG